tara:strand:+ start:562 stop:753 length:192 start_codon:yes stop_codon:yes gene_type:complete
MKWFKIARLVIGAVRAAVLEAEDAQEPSSEGGKKITPEEGLHIAAAVLSSLVEPLADLLADAE